MSTINITHFNPGQVDEPSFLASFIARKKTFQYFLNELRHTQEDQAARHHLIIAPRGYGKTSLLRRIQIALRTEAEFNTRFIALAFREEQHNVISLDVFWRNCIQSLLEAREDEHAPEAEIDALDALWLQHAPRSGLKREDQDGTPAWTAFEAECERLGRRPVLLVDNLDALLAGLDKHQWGLRTALQQANGPVLIAAASRYPEQLSDNTAAFFDFFRITTLARLSDQEVTACLRALATKRGAKGEPVLRLLETDMGRISALNTMAGGNPRTLGVLYTVLEAHMSDDILAQLSAMLDTFTGWYQARTEELPMQSRAVFDALALNWDPMTAAALSTVSGMETTVVSSQLSRLEKAGYVEAVALSSTRKGRNGYQVAERFYNIWYLMRNGPRRTRQSIRWLTVFLRSCFTRRELNTMAQDKLRNGCDRIESTLALADSVQNQRIRSQLLDAAENHLSNGHGDAEMYGVLSEMKNGLAKTKTRKAVKAKLPSAFDKAFVAVAVAVAHQAGDHVQEKSCLLKAIALDPKNGQPYIPLGNLLKDQQRYEEAEAAYRSAIKFNEKDAIPWNNLGNILKNHLHRYEEAEDAYRRAIQLNGKYAIPWNGLGNLLQDYLQRYEEAEAAYRRAIELDEKNAKPWSGLGNLLQVHMQRYAEAETAYRRAIELDKKDLGSWNNLGNLLQDVQRYEEAEAIYRHAIDLNEKNPMPWNGLGNLLQDHLQRYEEAEIAYRRAIELDEKNAGPWNNLGNLLKTHLQRYEEAEAAYRHAIDLNEKLSGPWANLGNLLKDQHRYEEAETSYRRAIELHEKSAIPWNGLGNLLQDQMGKYDDALQVYLAALESHPEDPINLANIAYLQALHLDARAQAVLSAQQAIPKLSPAGKCLLESLLAWTEPAPAASANGWQKLHEAVTSDDDSLWSTYQDDLQRLLTHALVKGDGPLVRGWMEDAHYPQKYAPLYHAFCAALDGEDHLLTINPEVRSVAAPLYQGLARMRALFLQHRQAKSPVPKAGKKISSIK